jgi:hypothetical protein
MSAAQRGALQRRLTLLEIGRLIVAPPECRYVHADIGDFQRGAVQTVIGESNGAHAGRAESLAPCSLRRIDETLYSIR